MDDTRDGKRATMDGTTTPRQRARGDARRRAGERWARSDARGDASGRGNARRRRRERFDTPVGSPETSGGAGDARGRDAFERAARGRRERDGRRRWEGRASETARDVGGKEEVRAGGGSEIENLPRDCLAHACSFADAATVEALGLTSRTMREATLDDSLWKSLCEARWRWRASGTWARSARLPFESVFGTSANAEKRRDIFRGGEGWRRAYKERLQTRGIARVAGKRVIRVECDGGVMQASALQRVLNATLPGDVVCLGKGTYEGSLTIPRGIEIVGVDKRENVLIVSDETPAMMTSTAMNASRSVASVVTNVTLLRRGSAKRSSSSGYGHQACVYVSDGSRLRLDSCDIVSAGEGVVATAQDSAVHVHACNIHSVLSSFLSTSRRGSSLTACRITAAKSSVEDAHEEEVIDEIESLPSSLGYDRLFAAVTALSGPVEICNNRIVNGFAHGVVLFDCAHGNIHDNLIANNVGAGISVGVSSTANISNTIVANNSSVGIAMCGRGTIRHSEVRGNAFNGIDIAQRYTNRDYLTARFDAGIDEELDLEEEFSAFLMDLDSDDFENEKSSEEIDVLVEGCHVSKNANDGVCVSGGANVDVIHCEINGNLCNIAIDRGNVRWSRVLVEGESMHADAPNVRVAESHSTLIPMPTSIEGPQFVDATVMPKLRRFIPNPSPLTVVL